MWRGDGVFDAYYCIPLSPTLARVIKRKAIVVGEWYIHQNSYQQNGWAGYEYKGKRNVPGRCELVRSKGILSVASVYFRTKVPGKLLFHITIIVIFRRVCKITKSDY